MQVLKNISDELWLGLIFILVAVWMYFLNRDYIIISGVFAFVGILLLIVDNIKKANKPNLKADTKIKTSTK